MLPSSLHLVMKVLRNNFTSTKSTAPNQFQTENLDDLIDNLLVERGEQNDASYEWIDGETIEVKNMSVFTLHNIIERAQECGKGLQVDRRVLLKVK